VDHPTRQVIDIIPTRDRGRVAEFLGRLENLSLVTRDGSPSYKSAVSDRSAAVVQVSDRFHFFAALTEAVCLDLRGIIPPKICFLGGSPVEMRDLTGTLRQRSGYDRRKKLAELISSRYAETGNMSAVAREFGLCAATVKKYLASGAPSGAGGGSGRLDRFREAIRSGLAAGETGAAIWRRIKSQGYSGSLSSVESYRSNLLRNRRLLFVDSVDRGRFLGLLFDRGITDLFDEGEARLVKRYIKDECCSPIRRALELFTRLRIFFHKRDAEQFGAICEKLLKEERLGRTHRIIEGIKRDGEAVANSFKCGYTNGLVEGKVCKIKQIKRTMYGRCSFFLLRQKLLLQNHIN
jgi:hypothetical protein